LLRDKPTLIKAILQEIKANGAQFLKRSEVDEDIWEEVDDAYAYAKVGHALRWKKSRRKNYQASMAAAACPPVEQASSMRQDRAWVGNPVAGLLCLESCLLQKWLFEIFEALVSPVPPILVLVEIT
jgi:hypothetical protein